jgi:hypothetical protein
MSYQKLSNSLYLPLVMKAICMTTVPTPTIWIYGGIHNDPGSRQRFLEQLAKREIAPHFVAVEWEQSVFARFAACRAWVAKEIGKRWDFLTPKECDELACTLAWEGDAYRARFPDTEPLWLDTGFQEALLQRPGRNADEAVKDCANTLLHTLRNPCYPTPQETFARIAPPPEPRSKQQLLDRVSTLLWATPNGGASLERDARWATMLCERSAGLCDGWIAVVVGWAHANPQENPQRLRGLLRARGFCVNAVYLGP